MKGGGEQNLRKLALKINSLLLVMGIILVGMDFGMGAEVSLSPKSSANPVIQPVIQKVIKKDRPEEINPSRCLYIKEQAVCEGYFPVCCWYSYHWQGQCFMCL